MNSNLFHNLANGASLALAVLTAVLMSSGCVTAASGAIDCSGSWINPTYTTIVIAALQAIKILVNVVRDGVSGLAKAQPPVKQ